MTTDGLGSLAAALAKAQSAFGPVTKDKTVTVTTKTGGQYKFAYAPLDQILSVVKGPLATNGLALVQLLDSDALVTMLIHDSGASLEAHTPLPPSNDIQAYGSAITYLRRYAIQALLGIAAEDDDDANRAAGNQAEPGETTQKGGETVELLGRIQKRGKVEKGGAEGYKVEWREEPSGHVIGFRLNIDGEDRAIPQVLVGGLIGEALYVGDPEILGTYVTVKGHLYNVKVPGRRSYYRLIVGEHPDNEFIETANLRIPTVPDVSPLRDEEPQEAPSEPLFDAEKLDPEERLLVGGA